MGAGDMATHIYGHGNAEMQKTKQKKDNLMTSHFGTVLPNLQDPPKST